MTAEYQNIIMAQDKTTQLKRHYSRKDYCMMQAQKMDNKQFAI